MHGKVRFALMLGASWGVVVLAGAAVALLAAADLGEAERALLGPILRERAPSLTLATLLLLVPLAVIVRALYRHHVTAPAKLVEDAHIMLAANPSHRAPARGS